MKEEKIPPKNGVHNLQTSLFVISSVVLHSFTLFPQESSGYFSRSLMPEQHVSHPRWREIQHFPNFAYQQSIHHSVFMKHRNGHIS